MPTTIDALVARAKQEAAVQTQEPPFTDSSDALLKTFASEALTVHNPDYTVETLPDKEIPLVVLLIRISICEVRVNKFSSDNSLSGVAGYGQDRNSPFYKTMELIKELQARYNLLASNLGLSPVSQGTVQVSSLRIVDSRTNLVVPASTDKPPTPTLSLLSKDSTEKTAIVGWTIKEFNNFRAYYFGVLNVANDLTLVILAPWNVDSASGIPGLVDDSEVVNTSFGETTRQAKLTGIDSAVNNYKVVLIVESVAGFYSYSNEVTIPKV